MITSPLPLPGPRMPGGSPPVGSAGSAPSAAEAAEGNPNGFARLLDKARDEPASRDAHAADHDRPANGGHAAAENASPAKALRNGQGRPAPKTEAPARTPVESPVESPANRPHPTDDRGDTVELLVVGDVSLDGATVAPDPSGVDAAALLASLAAFARPHLAPGGAAGKASGASDEADAQSSATGGVPTGDCDTNADMSADTNGGKLLGINSSIIGTSTGVLASQTTARSQLAAASDGSRVTPGSAAGNKGDALAADGRSAAATAATKQERRLDADTAASSAGRSFAAELQAALGGPLPAQAMGGGPALGALPTGSTPAPQGHMQASPGSPAFAPELGATLATFVREGVHHARLELNPAAMGPLTVQIQIDGQTANVHLAAHNADTRHALEQAMPTLASSLREAGLMLSGGGVFEQPRQPQPDASAGQATRRANGEQAVDDDERGTAAHALQAPHRRRGVVDLIA